MCGSPKKIVRVLSAKRQGKVECGGVLRDKEVVALDTVGSETVEIWAIKLPWKWIDRCVHFTLVYRQGNGMVAASAITGVRRSVLFKA
ncbi:hypothetical protein Gohar_025678 [Gossypium harknessii]|uniref:Uncharacterized protein n=1 Tax=Gossypium harknessii TaxID=34285 RepID=A0A7J9I970_9ROSI|nr:hypothetical protein [Gossypium harknessii]